MFVFANACKDCMCDSLVLSTNVMFRHTDLFWFTPVNLMESLIFASSKRPLKLWFGEREATLYFFVVETHA